jgi:hypothetical protein
MTLSRHDNWKLDTPVHYKERPSAECQRCGADFTNEDLWNRGLGQLVNAAGRLAVAVFGALASDEPAALCGPCGEDLDPQAADPDRCEVCDGEGSHGCGICAGSGEGMADGTTCPACGGRGEVDCECADDEDDEDDEPDDREADDGDYDRAADAYECEMGGGR